jgi:hypothetical protein
VHLGRLLTLVLLLVELVVGIVALVVSLFLVGLVYGAFFSVSALIGFIVYIKLGKVDDQIGSGQYGSARDGLLIWGILAVIFVWVIPGIFVLLAYLRLDEAMHESTGPFGYAAPSYPGTYPAGPAPGAYAPAPPPSSPTTPQPPLPPPPPPPGPVCPTCGQPATFIPQYNRYYCYHCQRYL